MDPVTLILIFVTLLLIAREIIHVITLNKLINKVMSRNYHDYVFSKNSDKIAEQNKNTLKQGLQSEQDLKEDLAPVESFLF